MNGKNCWEFKRCGRGPAGKNDCPAAKDSTLNGVHKGVNAGRACWVSAGTSGDAAMTGTFAIQLRDCFRCDFYRLVQAEEGRSETGFSATRLGMLKMIQQSKPSQHASSSVGSGHIDANLRDEFVKEVNNILSVKNNMDQDLQEEFAREVSRLTSKPGKSST
jgi:hypothetical protein